MTSSRVFDDGNIPSNLIDSHSTNQGCFCLLCRCLQQNEWLNSAAVDGVRRGVPPTPLRVATRECFRQLLYLIICRDLGSTLIAFARVRCQKVLQELGLNHSRYGVEGWNDQKCRSIISWLVLGRLQALYSPSSSTMSPWPSSS